MDIVDKQTRSRMMSNIKGKNTKPEITIRSLLHREGFRFTLHDKLLPGKPDIVFKRYRAVTGIDMKTVSWLVLPNKISNYGWISLMPMFVEMEKYIFS